uniref:Putative secreted protein n=1 Tax=Rhipicephalus microplus TaxID=6941 RepID=A0A6G5A2I9_RHIMP
MDTHLLCFSRFPSLMALLQATCLLHGLATMQDHASALMETALEDWCCCRIWHAMTFVQYRDSSVQLPSITRNIQES